MADQQHPLTTRLEAAASALVNPAAANSDSEVPGLLRYLGYDDGDAIRAEGRARMLRAAARFRRLFLLSVPDAPGLVFFGGEADPAALGRQPRACRPPACRARGCRRKRPSSPASARGSSISASSFRPMIAIERGPFTEYGDSS